MTSRGGRGTKKPEAADAGAKRNVARTAEGKAARGRPKTKAPTETIHERSARLQREGNLPREVRPGEPLTVERQVNPYLLGPDVHGAEALNAIHALRGDRQLGAALSGRSIEALREMQTGIGAPGARNKADLISNIVSHVTGGRYSANFGASGARSAAAARGAGGDRRAAGYEARIARKEADLAALRKEYEDYRKSKGLSDGEHDDHTLRLLERMDTTRATLRRMRDEYTGRTGRRI